MQIFRILFGILVSVFSLAGCTGDEPDNMNESGNDVPNNESELFMKLADTSWKLVKSVDGTTDMLALAINQKYKGETITFSSERYNSMYKMYCSAFSGHISWFVEDDDTNRIFITNMGSMSSWDVGAFCAVFGSGSSYISISGNQMTLTSANKSPRVQEYIKVSTSGSGDGNDTSYESPDVDFYDYTQIGSSKVKVDYIIYNKTEASVSSATIKYGTTSSTANSATTTISGKHAIATISGLTANRDYYVRCQVKYQNGTATTETTKIRLSEW